jgi:hypothetical protein
MGSKGFQKSAKSAIRPEVIGILKSHHIAVECLYAVFGRSAQSGAPLPHETHQWREPGNDFKSTIRRASVHDNYIIRPGKLVHDTLDGIRKILSGV